MNYDLLLQYLTELGTGKWQIFRDALDCLASPGEQLFRSMVARNLSLLGHVEFTFFDNMAWAVCPETLVMLSNEKEHRAVLCGSRSQALIDSLTSVVDEMAVSLQTRIQEEGPAAVVIRSHDQNALATFAERTGIPLALSVPARLAGSLPRLQRWLTLCEPGWEPLGYTVKLFDAEHLCWQRVERSAGDGLYQYAYYRYEYRLRRDGQSLRVPREIGMYSWLAHIGRSVLHYDPDHGNLQVPAITRMPPLHARAATLSSGLLPTIVRIDGRVTHIYSNVSEDVAHLLAIALDQKLEG